MTVKNISTRAKICGRSAKCTGGHSAVEQSSYISREKMYCEYDGQTYYPKYSEDLVHCEVLLPENAPEEYKDPYEGVFCYVDKWYAGHTRKGAFPSLPSFFLFPLRKKNEKKEAKKR